MLTEGHCSAAVYLAGKFGEDEQPTAVKCNYERNRETHTVQTDQWAVWAVCH
jgi:hypothetical protein